MALHWVAPLGNDKMGINGPLPWQQLITKSLSPFGGCLIKCPTANGFLCISYMKSWGRDEREGGGEGVCGCEGWGVWVGGRGGGGGGGGGGGERKGGGGGGEEGREGGGGGGGKGGGRRGREEGGRRKEWRREMREGEEWEGMRVKGGRNGWTRSDKMVVVLS